MTAFPFNTFVTFHLFTIRSWELSKTKQKIKMLHPNNGKKNLLTLVWNTFFWLLILFCNQKYKIKDSHSCMRVCFGYFSVFYVYFIKKILLLLLLSHWETEIGDRRRNCILISLETFHHFYCYTFIISKISNIYTKKIPREETNQGLSIRIIVIYKSLILFNYTHRIYDDFFRSLRGSGCEWLADY